MPYKTGIRLLGVARNPANGFPARLLVANLPGVGQNLRDHPSVRVTWKTKEGFPLDGLAPRGQLTLRYTADGSHLRNDMKISMQSYATGRVNQGGNRMEPLGIRINGGIYLAAGAGELRLASTDPNVQPILDYNYLQDPFDRDRLREMVRLCVQLETRTETPILPKSSFS